METNESTKERLFTAAEKLYAEKGFSGVSLRDITTEADANVAAVNYYYGGKEALADAVIAEHIIPVNEARLKALKQLEREYKEDNIPVRRLLEGFMRPLVTHVQSGGVSEQLFAKIMGRCMGDKAEALPEVVIPDMKKVVSGYVAGLKNSLPDLSDEMVLWRLHFSFGVLAHTLTYSDRLEEFTGMSVGVHDLESRLNLVIDYCIGGVLVGVEKPEANKNHQNEFLF